MQNLLDAILEVGSRHAVEAIRVYEASPLVVSLARTRSLVVAVHRTEEN